MSRDRSPDDDIDNVVGEDRSRSRERNEQPRGRPVRRQVANPFRSPGRRAPLPADAWFRQGDGYPISPASYGGPPLPADRHGDAQDVGSGHAESTRAAGAAAAQRAAHDDVDMGEDDGFVRQVWNAPAIPQAPLFKGSTKAERRSFMREYQKYLAQINALQCVGSRPFAMPVSACMDPFSKRRIALFDMKKDHNVVTEEEWVAWFHAAFEEDPQDLDVLKKRLSSAIRFDTRILDAESRVGRMLDELMRVLEQDHQEWVLHQEGKMVVEIMTKAIKPETLKSAVQKQLQLQRNKGLKNDVFRYVKWLRQFAAGFQLYVGLDEAAPGPPPGATKTDNAKGGRGKSNGSDKGPGKPEGGGGKSSDNAKFDSGAPGSEKPATNSTKEDSRPKKKLGCLKCGDKSHRVADCPKAAPGEADRLLEAQLKKWREGGATRDGVTVLGSQPNRRTTERGALVEGLVRVENILLDTGADVNVVSRGVMDALVEKNAKVVIQVQDQPRLVYPYGADAKPLEMKRHAKFGTVTLDTTCGPLTLRGLRAWIDETSTAMDFIVSRPVMEVLGYSIDDLLDGARRQQAEWDVSAGAEVPATSMSRVQRLLAEERDPHEPELSDSDGMECATPDVEKPPSSDDNEERRRKKRKSVFGVLMNKVAEAETRGLSPSDVERLKSLLSKHVDVFREDLGDDAPVKVEPLKVRIKPNSVPVKCGMRRYPPAHVEYMREHVDALQANGMVYLNNRSTWAAAPRIVPKKEAGALRMTIDSRPINACTEPMPWPMPNLDSAMVCLVGTTVYFTLDWTKGYWQLPLHPESQEFFSFLTPFGVFTPTRVLMGQTDAVAYCQSVVHQMFGDLLFRGLLAWLDDLLGSAKTVAELFDLLDQVLSTCGRFGLKLNPKKCDFYLKEAEWCGKVISAAGVTHSPKRIQGLVDLSPPTTAADLQQFVCATNWMRASIPSYNQLIDPLRRLLDIASKTAGSSKKTALARVALAAIGWSDDHDKCFNDVKNALMHVVPLSHPRDDMEVCVFTDASDQFWGAVATQVPPADLDKPLEDQRHEPLAFISGTFAGASARWPIVEKEAYAVVESCKRLDYLVVRPGGFRLFTDHRNLVYMFNPRGSNGNLAKYQADKLQRWALVMSTFPYTIECLPGDVNVWGDLLSRWGSSPTAPRVAHVRRLVHVVSPLHLAEFEWPTATSILKTQKTSIEGGEPTPPGVGWNEDLSFYTDESDRVWVPDSAVDLQQRLCVIAHQGASGHRRIAATTKSVADKFVWKTLSQDVSTFVRGCLHCLQVDGDVVPRPLGSALHAEKPNELIHFDWLSMPKTSTGLKNILVIKDDMSGFVHLHAAESADSTATAAALMSWFTLYGCVDTWVSDGGAHFKNEVVEKIRKMVGAHHHITTAYSPWANGTVEVVNRLVLRAVKALLNEMRLKVEEWHLVLPLVQGALNHQPADRLGGVAPVTAFTGLPAMTPMSGFVHPATKEVHAIDYLDDVRRDHIDSLAEALDDLHRDVSTRSQKLRQQARDRHGKKNKVKFTNFTVGDYVLVGSVVQRSNKLALQWRGPNQVVRVVTDHVMETQQLVPPFSVSTHHACRLKMFRDASLEVTEDLVNQIAHGDGGFHVERLEKVRVVEGDYQVQVKWMGLADEEMSWELAKNLLDDIPVVFTKWCKAHQTSKNVSAMMKNLGLL